MVSMLRLRLLGPMQIDFGGETVTLAARKARALLAYLALRPGEAVPRETLVGLLWAERGEEQARASLRQALSSLRKALGAEANRALNATKEAVCLAPERIWVDANLLTGAIDHSSLDALTEAASLYRGELLEGLALGEAPFDQWLATERERMRAAQCRLLSRLVDCLASEHHVEEAIVQATRLVALDPLQESVHRRLMQLYLAQGRHDAALGQFEHCRRYLAEQLDVTPEQETLDLVTVIKARRRQVSHATPAKREAPPTLPVAPATTEKATIAVLPFANLSADPEQEYFADGITEEIIIQLTRFRCLTVIARNSSFHYKGRAVIVQEAARELNVQFLVEGSVRRAGDRVRITTQLIDGVTGRHIWAGRFERQLEDVFAVQDEASQSVVAAIVGQLEESAAELVKRKPPQSATAYDFFLRGLKLYQTHDDRYLIEARRLFRKSIELDENFARPRAYLALATFIEVFYAYGGNPDLEEALVEARMAVELDRADPQAHAALGLVRFVQRHDREGLASLRRAIALNPNDPELAQALGFVLTYVGELEEAVSLLRSAIRLNPFPSNSWVALGIALYQLNRYVEAVEVLQGWGHWGLCYWAVAKAQLGDIEEAKVAAQRFFESFQAQARARGEAVPTVSEIIRLETDFMRRATDAEHLLDGLRKAGVELSDRALLQPVGMLAPMEKATIAVLPFANLSADPEQEYFADGITEEIITALGRFRSLCVIAGASSFVCKARTVSLQDCAAALGARYVVEGSVRRGGQALRITAQLLDAQAATQLWAERYDGAFEDVFALQDEVTGKIVSTLVGHLEEAEQQRSLRGQPETLSAYDLWLRGKYFLNKGTKNEVLEARRLFEKAIDLDPAFASAYVELSWTYCAEFNSTWTVSKECALQQAYDAVQNAIDIDPHDSRARMVLAWADFKLNVNFDFAYAQIEQALNLNPNDYYNYCVRSWLSACSGELEDARTSAREALARSPIMADGCLYSAVVADYLATDYGAAICAFSRMRQPDPELHAWAAAAYAQLGRMPEAAAKLETFYEALRPFSDVPVRDDAEGWRGYWAKMFPARDPAAREHLLDGLRKAGMVV